MRLLPSSFVAILLLLCYGSSSARDVSVIASDKTVSGISQRELSERFANSSPSPTFARL